MKKLNILLLVVIILMLLACTTEKDRITAFDEGKIAAEKGLLIDVCPYGTPNAGTTGANDRLYTEWRRGWAAGAQQR